MFTDLTLRFVSLIIIIIIIIIIITIINSFLFVLKSGLTYAYKLHFSHR